jgi:hypothetical protein
MKKLIFFTMVLFLTQIFACKKETVNSIQDDSANYTTKMTRDENGIVTLVINPKSRLETDVAEERTACPDVYHCIRFLDVDDYLTTPQNAIASDVEFRILQFPNSNPYSLTAITSYQTATNATGLNIDWSGVLNSNPTGYSYRIGWKTCVRTGTTGGGANYWGYDFFGDNWSAMVSDPYWNAIASGQIQPPFYQVTSPINELGGAFSLTSCVMGN